MEDKGTDFWLMGVSTQSAEPTFTWGPKRDLNVFGWAVTETGSAVAWGTSMLSLIERYSLGPADDYKSAEQISKDIGGVLDAPEVLEILREAEAGETSIVSRDDGTWANVDIPF